MKNKKFNSIIIAYFLISAVIFSTSCDNSFYLTEKEFYALRGQLATASVANQVFSGVQGQQLQINFDNSVSPPRVQSSNLEDFIRNHLPTLALLEAYPSNSLQIDRVSDEIEKQFDNWLANRLRLYTGANNAAVSLERVDAMRIQFMNNPTFSYSENKIVFNTTLQMTIDCRIKVDALDPITNFLFGGVNGTYDVAIDVQNLQMQGEISFVSLGEDSSDMQFKLTPTVGNVVVRDRGIVTPTAVKNGIRDVIKTNLKVKIEENFSQKYDYFALNNCRVSGEFACEYNALPLSPSPELHTVARGTDNKLYAAVRRNNVWSNYKQICCTSSQIQINFTSDPSLAVSSAGTIELAATISSGEIFYAQYQNGWKNYRFLLPPQGQSYRGKPAIVATAPGQVEIFVARADNKIVHLRKINGNWTAPVVINLPVSTGTIQNITFLTYRDPTAVLSGNKIFLTAVASNNRLYAIIYDIETGLWGKSSQISTSENVNFTPALASGGDGRIDLVYVGQSGSVYHRPITINVVNIFSSATIGFVLSTETNIPGSVNAAPFLAASGYRQLDLVARGTDNRLYYNHFVGTQSPTGFIDGRNVVQGWSGWGFLNGNFYGTQLLSNEYTEEFALAATKTGKLDVVARIRANSFSTAYTLHHNSFDAAGFGNNPWKTVHWRGYQKIGNQQFNGRPALAALDENFEIAFVGQGSNIYNAQHGAEDFAQLVGFQILSNPTTVDPLAVSSGKGLVDLIAVGTDRKIRHIRYYNDLRLLTTILPAQTNLTFQSRPAVVGYGDGQLDVIGVSTTGSIYHWRCVNGIWQNPQQISGMVISSPILVNTGGGQLELFAIGGDNKLYRWRFLGGAWGNWQQIPGTFTINPNRFGQGSAMTSSDGALDLAVVSNQAGAAVYHRYVEPRDDTVSLPNLPAQTFRSLGSWANSQPFVGTFSKNEKFVIVGDSFSSDFKYYSLNNSANWQTGVLRGNNLGLQIGGIANLPTGAVVVATDLSGKIYFHNQFVAENPRFDFAPVSRQTAQSQLRLPLYRPTVASFGGQ